MNDFSSVGTYRVPYFCNKSYQLTAVELSPFPLLSIIILVALDSFLIFYWLDIFQCDQYPKIILASVLHKLDEKLFFLWQSSVIAPKNTMLVDPV